MPGVFREIELAYGGKTYTLTPSVKMLRRIEGQGDINILSVIHKVGMQAETGALPIFDLATIACGFLREAGCKVDEDEVYAEIMADLTQGDAKWMMGFCEVLVAAISPPEQDPKKADASPATPKRSKARSSR